MIFLRIPLVGLFAALLAFAPAASADPALWKVSSGVSTAYIFGSVHLLEKSVVWKNPKVQAALDQSQEIWLEVADLDNPVLAKSLTTQYGLDDDRVVFDRFLDVASLERGRSAGVAAL